MAVTCPPDQSGIVIDDITSCRLCAVEGVDIEDESKLCELCSDEMTELAAWWES